MANPANFARHNQAFNSDSLQRGICFANFTPRCKPLRRQAGSVLPVNLALACEKPALFSPMLYSPVFIFSSVYSLGFYRVPGFALGRCAVFKPFWPLALVRQAPPAIIFQAVRRLGGALFFRGLRPSSIWGFPFWLLGLTGQSSRPAFGGRLTFVR